MDIYCENVFCIYWKDNKCIADKIALNSYGQCQTHIDIPMDVEVIERGRKLLLEQYQANNKSREE